MDTVDRSREPRRRRRQILQITQKKGPKPRGIMDITTHAMLQRLPPLLQLVKLIFVRSSPPL